MPTTLQVIARLNALGYMCLPDDDAAVTDAIMRTASFIKGYCNLTRIPDRLYYAMVDMSAAAFLKEKIATGKTDGLEGIDTGGYIKSIKEGDVTYEMSGMTNALSSVKKYADDLYGSHWVELTACRRM